jgi:hypothetical protein
VKKIEVRTGYAYLTKQEVQQAVKLWLEEKYTLYIDSYLDVDIQDCDLATVKLWTKDEEYGESVSTGEWYWA